MIIYEYLVKSPAMVTLPYVYVTLSVLIYLPRFAATT